MPIGCLLICPPPVVLVAAAQGEPAEVSGRLMKPPIQEGGSAEDGRFARMALGFREGHDVTLERLRLGLEAVRATDRFRRVEGSLEEAPGGVVVRLYLDPWPALKSVETNVPKKLRSLLNPWLGEIKKGTRPGDIALGAWEKRAREWLVVWGYPSAQVSIVRSAAGDSLYVSIEAGEPTLVRRVEITGDTGAVPTKTILKDIGCSPGRTVWTSEVQRNAVQRLNRRFSKSGHLFARVVFSWDRETGILGVGFTAGPVVSLRTSGIDLSAGQLKEYLSLPSVERFGTDFLGEAERRLAGRFQSEGRLFAKVSLVETQVGSKPLEKAVRLECDVAGYDALKIDDIAIKGNAEIKESELLKAAMTDFGGVFSSRPKATPEYVDACLRHVQSYCLSLGYADVRVSPEWLQEGKRWILVIAVSEGRRQDLQEIVVGYGENPPAEIEKMREAMFGFMDPSRRYTKGVTSLAFSPRRKGWMNSRMRWEAAGENQDRFIFPDRTPFVRFYVVALRSALQEHLASTGVQKPVVNAEVSQDDQGGVTVQLEVPLQTTERIRRLVIQGAERTKAEFIRSEMRPTPNQPGLNFGLPLVAASASGSRANLGALGIFSSVDIRSMQEIDSAASDEQTPWSPGDILLRLKERQPWNFSTAFSFDRSVGYQVGLGAQRINVGGRAQTLDFNVRAGDGTIGNPWLRDFFRTSRLGRSLDVYSIGFSDPWLSTEPLSKLLAPRGLLRGDLVYIKEHRDYYLIFRRRLLSSLEWRVRDKKNDVQTVRLGYRLESASTDGQWEADTVRSPKRYIISTPFLQFTKDTRDHPFDPKRGGLTSVTLEAALEALGTTSHRSFIKMDLRQSWNMPVGSGAKYGVASLAVRLGAARPTAGPTADISLFERVPLSERYFAGGPGSHRGVEPDQLGPVGFIYLRDQDGNLLLDPNSGSPLYYLTPKGGQGLALVNFDYRFPLPSLGQWIWGELFADSGEVYERVWDHAGREHMPFPPPPFPHWRTSVGVGLVLKLGGFPIKVEYAWDARKTLGRGKGDNDWYAGYVERTRMKNLLISAGVQF